METLPFDQSNNSCKFSSFSTKSPTHQSSIVKDEDASFGMFGRHLLVGGVRSYVFPFNFQLCIYPLFLVRCASDANDPSQSVSCSMVDPLLGVSAKVLEKLGRVPASLYNDTQCVALNIGRLSTF